MSYYIPLEIQAEFMKRLPVKSLVRFKSVSKAWKSFINSSEFIADFNACHPQHCLLVACGNVYNGQKYVLIFYDDTLPLRKLSHTIPWSVNPLNYMPNIFGSSQGLFCFYGYTTQGRQMAVIWNPSIRKSVDIVVPNVLYPPYKTVVGFGVCPFTFDVKLVKITFDVNLYNYDRMTYIPWRVQVFTLRSGAWKSLFTNLPHKSTRFTENCVDLHGFIYWHAYDLVDVDGKTEIHNMIMSFDMASENFTEISLPDSLVDTCYRGLSISKRMESLVVLEYLFMAGKKVYNVWMMEGGVRKSFTKLFMIEAPEASIRSVLGFRMSGEPIIEMDNNGSDPDKKGGYLYEPNSRHISYIGISAQRDLLLASTYTDTLLLLDR